MRRSVLLVVIGVMLLTTEVLAATLKDENGVRTFADKIMAKVALGNLDAAFEEMKPYVGISATEVDAAAIQSKAQREQFGKRYGPTVSYEFIDSKKIGSSLIRLRYIEKTDKHALPWKFYFYKTSKGWILNSFFWNDMLPELFE